MRIYDFDDYRAFLRAWRAEKPKQRSQAKLARALALSDGQVSMVFSGKRDILPDDAPAWARVVHLDGDERSYFLALVRAERGDEMARQAAREEVLARRNFVSAIDAGTDPDDILSEWYPWAVLALARCDGFRSDPAWIASTLVPPVTLAEATAALGALVGRGWLVAEDSGWKVVERPVTLPDRTTGDAYDRARRLHRAHLQHAADALDLPGDDRHVVSVLFAAPRSVLPELKRRLDLAVKQAVEAAQTFDDPDQVLQVSLQVVPRSNRVLA